ncbi:MULTISPECIES: helix-turn-helix domain-containing protein [Nocardia]|uniref:helix-turn-helix domain-containing protein n=1 Tax=Nocardia TaxID=1817 RepID=UPI00292EE307|nr:AraC family transcriptional regulator [Nocardia canadensis]
MGAAPLPETCRPAPTVWLWAGHAIYRGPSLRLDRHCGSVGCLAVGLDGPFTIDADAIGTRTLRSVLVPPRTPHRIVADGRMLFCYLDPGSPRAAGCRSRMRADTGGFGIAHVDESTLIRLAEGDTAPDDLLDLVSGTAGPDLDPRIAAATALLCAHPAADLSADQLAAAVHLSKSRLLHLFSAQAGTSFRRYRVWARMLAVGRAVAEGADLTTAAADAGFASPSHFSDTFHALFGLTAADLLGSGVRIVVEDPGLLLPRGETAR